MRLRSGNGEIVEKIKSSAIEQYNLTVENYENTIAQMDANYVSKYNELAEEVRKLRASKEAAEREALAFRATAFQQLKDKDQVIASLSSKEGPKARGSTEYFNVASDEYQSCGKEPTNSGSTRTIPENRGSGEGENSQPPPEGISPVAASNEQRREYAQVSEDVFLNNIKL